MFSGKIRSVFFAVALFCCSPLCVASDAAMPHLSFDKKPYIPPKIIQDMSTWESDTGDQVVEIDLLDSVNANRYFGDINVSNRGGANPYVHTEDTLNCEDDRCRSNPPSFGYQLIGHTPSGVYVLFTESSGGGSGRFRGLMFVSFEKDKGLANYSSGTKLLGFSRDRWLIKKLGELPLGDRYDGAISLHGNILSIGADDYAPSAGFFEGVRNFV